KQEAINKVIEAKNNVVNRFNELKTQAVNKVNEFKNNIKDKFIETKDEMINKAKEAVTDTVSKIGELPGKIKEKATEFFDAGKNIVTSIADGINSAIGKVTDAIGNVTKKIRDFLPFSPSKEGPLRDIMNVKIAESIAEAIRRGRNSAVKEMEKLASDLFETAQPKRDLLTGIRGYTANSVLSSFLPTNFAIQQEIIYKQANAGRYDDSRVIQLLKQLVEKDGNVYIDRERVGSILDEEQARRIKLLEGWVAID